MYTTICAMLGLPIRGIDDCVHMIIIICIIIVLYATILHNHLHCGRPRGGYANRLR